MKVRITMSQSPVNNINNVTNGTPLYNYQNSQIYAAPLPSSDQKYTSQIYQYPTSSIYGGQSSPQYSGVNIQIVNPAGCALPTSMTNAYPVYSMPVQTAAQPVYNQNIQTPQAPQASQAYSLANQQPNTTENKQASQPVNPSATTSIINNIPAQDAPIAQTTINNDINQSDKNQKTKMIVELTDDYIKTLENYLRSPDVNIRRSGIKELIKRFEEVNSRYNDPALTALLNIALQDSDATNRLLAMSPIASGSATGNDDTKTLLQNLTSSDKLYGQEAKMAADSLLNTAQTRTEVPDNSSGK